MRIKCCKHVKQGKVMGRKWGKGKAKNEERNVGKRKGKEGKVRDGKGIYNRRVGKRGLSILANHHSFTNKFQRA